MVVEHVLLLELVLPRGVKSQRRDDMLLSLLFFVVGTALYRSFVCHLFSKAR